MSSPPGCASSKQEATRFMLMLRNVLLFILWKWNAVNMGINIWLFCLSRKESLHEYQIKDGCVFIGYVCIYQYMQGNVDDVGYTVHLNWVYHWEKAFDCYRTTIISDHWSHVCLACLLSFSSGKWQINILFLDRCLLCVRGKASRAHFIHTQYTLSHYVY